MKEESRFVFYSIATGTIKAKSFATIPPEGKTMAELLKQGIFWLDVLAPTETEMRILSSVCHFVFCWDNYTKFFFFINIFNFFNFFRFFVFIR